jgi:Tfp pilus assembly protein PilF/serine/threonine protein kinase
MGAVWRADDPDLQRALAVKVLLANHAGRPDLEKRFLDEARLTGQLQHPGIPPVHEIGRLEDGRPFFAMKLIEGRTLDLLLKERLSPSDDLPRVLDIFLYLCQAVAYAHSHGVIHRDLKPANVMVGAFGEVQVMDWGLAKMIASQNYPSGMTNLPDDLLSHFAAEQTQVGSILGTPGYMPPEQARGEVGRLNERSDVFGLGAILCAVLTGFPPFTGEDTLALMRRAADGDLGECFTRLERCNAEAELIRIAKWCLAAEMVERPHHAGELATVFQAYQEAVQERLRTAEIQRARAEVKTAEERTRRRLILGLAGAIIVLLLLGAVGAWLFERQRSERRQRLEQLTDSIEAALARAVSFRSQARWSEAHAMLDLAEIRWDEAPVELRQRVAEARTNLRLVARLDAVRQDSALLIDGRVNTADAPAQYAAAFREHGFNFLAGDGEEEIRLLSASAIRLQLVTALDEWIAFEKELTTRRRLERITRRADPDEWRDRLRAAEIWQNPAELECFADQVPVSRLTATLAERVGSNLEKKGKDGLAILERMTQQKPNDFWLNSALANALRSKRRGRLKEAVGYYRAALAVRPDSSAVWNNLGLTLYQLGDAPASVASFRKAVAIDPKHIHALTNLGVALLAVDDLDGALDAQRRALAINSRFVHAINNQGVALVARNEVAGAINSFNKALEIDPRFARAQACLGSALLEKKDLDGAHAACNAAIASDPELAIAHANLGLVLQARGDLKAAAAALRKAEMLDPRDSEFPFSLGMVLLDDRDVDGALKEYRQAVTLNQRHARAHHNIGVLLMRRNELDGALAAFFKAVESKPRYVSAHLHIGVLLSRRGDERGAISAYRKVLAIDPEDTPTLTNLAALLVNRRELTEAAVLCHRAIKKEPNSPHGHGVLGRVLLQQGKFADACESLRRAISVATPGDGVHAVASAQLRNAERFHQAEQRLNPILQGKERARDADEMILLAQICHRFRNLPVEAVQFYTAAFGADPARMHPSLGVHHRSDAAIAALEASGGLSTATRPTEVEQASFRRQALAWLSADLAVWSKVDLTRPTDRARLTVILQRLQTDPSLSVVREPEQLVKLPEPERLRWRTLWDDITELLKTVREW